MFQIDTTGRTRGHSLKLVKCRCNKDIRKYFFSHRVVSKWNMLDNDSVIRWQRQLMVSRLNWNGNGQRRWVCFWTMSAGPRGRNGIPERPSCKYPASKGMGEGNGEKGQRKESERKERDLHS